jgi:hypothetical protein
VAAPTIVTVVLGSMGKKVGAKDASIYVRSFNALFVLKDAESNKIKLAEGDPQPGATVAGSVDIRVLISGYDYRIVGPFSATVCGS